MKGSSVSTGGSTVIELFMQHKFIKKHAQKCQNIINIEINLKNQNDRPMKFC